MESLTSMEAIRLDVATIYGSQLSPVRANLHHISFFVIQAKTGFHSLVS